MRSRQIHGLLLLLLLLLLLSLRFALPLSLRLLGRCCTLLVQAGPVRRGDRDGGRAAFALLQRARLCSAAARIERFCVRARASQAPHCCSHCRFAGTRVPDSIAAVFFSSYYFIIHNRAIPSYHARIGSALEQSALTRVELAIQERTRLTHS